MTGSKLGDLVTYRGNETKLGVYELIAERLSVDSSDVSDPSERGHQLEEEGVQALATLLGKKINTECGVWVSDEDPNIGVSPDGEIGTTAAVEMKCLSSAKHLKAYFERKIPSEYEEQIMQYFIVNEKLRVLYFAFYDPRIPAKPIHYIEVHRKDKVVKQRIEFLRDYQKNVLKFVNEKVNELMPL